MGPANCTLGQLLEALIGLSTKWAPASNGKLITMSRPLCTSRAPLCLFPAPALALWPRELAAGGPKRKRFGRGQVASGPTNQTLGRPNRISSRGSWLELGEQVVRRNEVGAKE